MRGQRLTRSAARSELHSKACLFARPHVTLTSVVPAWAYPRVEFEVGPFHRCLRYFRRRQRPGQRRTRSVSCEQLEPRFALAASITVNTVVDDDVRDDFLTLREAILITNRTLAIEDLTGGEKSQVVGTPTDSDRDTIGFNIPGEGVHRIVVVPDLPPITDSVIIDGYTQPGSRPNTNPFPLPLNASLRIELRPGFYPIYESPTGYSTPTMGLQLAAPNCTIRGLSIKSFLFENIVLKDSPGSVIEGNYIGAEADGTSPTVNHAHTGIRALNSAGLRIGGLAPAARNLIRDHAYGYGITLASRSGDLTLVQGNIFRENGTAVQVLNADAARTIIGGEEDPAGNIILSGSFGGPAIRLSSGVTVVQKNWIGLDDTGLPWWGNSGPAIWITSSGNSVIENRIAHNGRNFNYPNERGGIVIGGHLWAAAAKNNAVLRNSLFGNNGLGIDLFWAEDNDPGDADTGPNDLQNSPHLRAASLGDGTLTIGYSVPSDPAHSAFPLHVEFFLADADGEEGQTYLGSNLYTQADQLAGEKVFRLPVPAGLKIGEQIVATATQTSPGGGYGSTSEFSRGIPLAPLPRGLSPQFQAGTEQSVTDEVGLQSVAEWAQNISLGALAGEKRFAITVDRPDLFSVLPRIDATTGTLVYAPRPNASGLARVTVSLQTWALDSGQVDVSESQVFTITIDKPRPSYNAETAEDVNGDRIVTPADALAIINVLNAFGPTDVAGGESSQPTRYLDVSGDGTVTARDVLAVVNYLNAKQPGGTKPASEDGTAAGESSQAKFANTSGSREVEAAIDLLLAEQALIQPTARRVNPSHLVHN